MRNLKTELGAMESEHALEKSQLQKTLDELQEEITTLKSKKNFTDILIHVCWFLSC